MICMLNHTTASAPDGAVKVERLVGEGVQQLLQVCLADAILLWNCRKTLERWHGGIQACHVQNWRKLMQQFSTLLSCAADLGLLLRHID